MKTAERNLGGSAFPYDNTVTARSGMTLRDYFASKALQGLVTNGKVPTDKHVVARVSYEYADAMLLARNIS
jgi:hypothetical protein